MKTLIQQFKNAMAIIRQMKAEEWVFEGYYEYIHHPEFTCSTAKRCGVVMWVPSYSRRCEILNEPWQLGVFGVLVWYFGAGKRKKALEKKMHRRPSDLTT